MSSRLFALAIVALASSAARGGSYANVALCDETDGCLLNTGVCHPLCDPGACDCVPQCCYVPPFAIVHPYGYTGAEPALELKVCVDAAQMALAPTVERAIAMWEALQPSASQNCQHCTTWEGPFNVDGLLWAHAVILHELGHCALGLDHPERFWDDDWDGDFEPTNFTRSAAAAYEPEALSDGEDNIRGSRDDLHLAPGPQPAESVSWFRQADNDPFVVDDLTTIDMDTYSRSLSNLPPPDTWGASANLKVAQHVGYDRLQAVMFGLVQRRQYYRGVTADDVNMLKMARTGLDRLAETADDYTTDLQFVGDCSNPHDIKVSFGPMLIAGDLGECLNTRIDYSFTPPNPFLAFHFSIFRAKPAMPIEVRLDEQLLWTLGEAIFEDGFESGDFSQWSNMTDGLNEPDELTEEELQGMQFELQQELLIDEEIRLLEEQSLLPAFSDAE